MIQVTEHPVNLRIELMRLLEVFIKGGSLTATFDRLNDLEAEAITILKEDGYCILDTKSIEDLKVRDQARIKLNDDAIEADLLLIEENDIARASDHDLIQENYKARERDQQRRDKKDHYFELEYKNDYQIAALLEAVSDFELEKSLKALNDQELTASLEINSVDGGDINGRFRFVPEKLEEAGTLIAAILRSVRPKTT